MITFTTEYEGKQQTFEMSQEQNISKLKEMIIKEYNLTSDYIDINIRLERPIRSLGKFNLEPGVLPRTLDRYPFDKYDLDGRTIPISFEEVTGYSKTIIKKVLPSSGVYGPPQGVVRCGDAVELPKKTFDLDSIDDFPMLG